MIGHRLAILLGAVVAATLASALAQAPQNLVVQAPVEPPGLDLTATPASATAVLLDNVQECLVKDTPPTTGTTPSSCARASASTTAASW